MENKINLVEILKDCPKGMELDCAMLDNMVFEKIEFSSPKYPVVIRNLKTNTTISLTEYGQYIDIEEGKCIIFPKSKTTWEGFVPPCKYKNGDIVITTLDHIAIIKEPLGKEYSTHVLKIGNILIPDARACASRFATEEEKQELFKAIKKSGYKWNEETKTLEKSAEPKFKIRDYIRHNKKNTKRLVSEVCDDHYLLDEKDITLPFFAQDDWELVPNKYDITTLVPFESKVLVRHNIGNKWCGSFFSHIDGDFHSHCYKFVTTAGKSYPMCIPYADNQHLLGTTNDCEEYYKTWEE